MAEVKNSFLASKMNKDLDDRLIPNNEYRDALNISVSNSEDGDVGALENILQNTNIYPISSSNTDIPFNNGKIIGHVVDSTNDDIYLFYTNYIDQSAGGLNEHQAAYGSGTNSSIVRYNTGGTDTSTAATVLVQGQFLNFSQNSPIYGVNVVEDFLFWTDNRNQPRKINIKKAAANDATSSSPHYVTEDDISVAKYAPYKAIDLYKSYNGTYKTTMKDVSSEFLPDGTTNNPDYNPEYSGDSNFLEDKFVRFSYRIKYEDGEYSIMAPFTQIAFIPKQDGSFLAGDETSTFQSTVVSFMENKVDLISLVINLPDTGNNLESVYKIKEIDILYKESNGIAISILDTVEVSTIKSQSLNTSVYEYSYQSRKPIKTLPQNQSTRVYDKTPVRALAQEVSGNRVIYGNFINKHTAPIHFDYQVSVTQKFSTGFNNDYSWIEYPEHTLKRNRSYQVGFVLSDRYGRQSDVILSSVIDNSTSNIFGASTFYVPYRVGPTNPTTFLADIGNSIKLLLNETIKSTRSPLTLDNLSSTGEPGIYDATNNPTGWYSYKIVVKQTQQEYYNVYLPGFLKGDFSADPNLSATHSVLIGDNINKVPRDLQEVGPTQTKFSSDEVLFPVVENYAPTSAAGTNWNQAFFPGNNKYEVTTISNLADLNNLGLVGSATEDSLFENLENPLIMRIGDNEEGLGAINDYMTPFLSVAETTPYLSNLDIYYETTSTGLVTELNDLVLNSGGNSVIGFSTFDYNQSENQAWNGSGDVTGAQDSPYITNEMIPINNLNQLLTNTEFISLSVLDGLNNDRTSQFEIVSVGGASNGYRLKLKDIDSQFYYGADASTRESYRFTIGIRNIEDDTTATLDTAVTGETQITITVPTGASEVFRGQVLTSGSETATVTSVDDKLVTLNISVTLTAGAALVFTAPVSIFPNNGALGNDAPYVDSTTYETSAYSTMTGTYATMVSYNGSFDTDEYQEGITYTWSPEQPLFPSSLGSFVISSPSSPNSVITLTNPDGGGVELFVNQSGVVSIVSGPFTFLSQFTLKVTVTDAGGMSVQNDIEFTDVIPGAFSNAFSLAFDI